MPPKEQIEARVEQDLSEQLDRAHTRLCVILIGGVVGLVLPFQGELGLLREP